MRRIPAAILAMSVGALALLAPGCASSKPAEDAPAWYVDAMSDKNSQYPSLRSVPATNDANNDPAHWNAVAEELQAAAAAMRANPRSEPANASDAAAFAEEARRDIEATRDTH
jgi:hypothetical protein